MRLEKNQFGDDTAVMPTVWFRGHQNRRDFCYDHRWFLDTSNRGSTTKSKNGKMFGIDYLNLYD